MVAIFLEVVLIEIHQASIDQTSIVQQLQEIHQTSINKTSFNQTSLIQQLQGVDLSLQILVLVMALVFGSQPMDVITLMEVDFIAQQRIDAAVFILQQLVNVGILSKEVYKV